MPLFDYSCSNEKCKCFQVKKEVFVKKHDDVVICKDCNEQMKKHLGAFKFTYGTGHFFEPYVDTDIHPDGEPIKIHNQQEFFSACEKHGRGWRKVSDKIR